MREPGGETQILEPRPRPASWVVAVKVVPVGRRRRRRVFFSRRLLVEVTTSPYIRGLPNLVGGVEDVWAAVEEEVRCEKKAEWLK
jgi:hypothetical protein